MNIDTLTLEFLKTSRSRPPAIRCRRQITKTPNTPSSRWPASLEERPRARRAARSITAMLTPMRMGRITCTMAESEQVLWSKNGLY
jgi:hypothetical protein